MANDYESRSTFTHLIIMLIKYVILYRSGKLYNKIYTLMKFLITFKKKSKDKMHEIKQYIIFAILHNLKYWSREQLKTFYYIT